MQGFEVRISFPVTHDSTDLLAGDWFCGWTKSISQHHSETLVSDSIPTQKPTSVKVSTMVVAMVGLESQELGLPGKGAERRKPEVGFGENVSSAVRWGACTGKAQLRS